MEDDKIENEDEEKADKEKVVKENTEAATPVKSLFNASKKPDQNLAKPNLKKQKPKIERPQLYYQDVEDTDDSDEASHHDLEEDEDLDQLDGSGSDAQAIPSTSRIKKEKEGEESEKDAPRLRSVLTYHETLIPGVERKLSSRLDHAFAPCRILMLTLFRFPLQLNVRRDYSRTFAYSWKSFRGWMFFITGGLLVLNGVLIMLGLAAILLDYQPGYSNPKKDPKVLQKLRLEELFLLQRNFVPMILLLLSLIHVGTGDVSLFFRRNFIAKYFTFWDEAVEIMKIDAARYPENVRKFMSMVTIFYACFLVIIMSLSIAKIAPVSTGAPAQLVILWSRLFYPQIHAWKHFHYVRYVGYVVYAYILACSKVYVLLLLYKCKIMKNAFATWNERLEHVMHKRKKEKRSRKEQCENRTGYDHLFRDYVVLLDLLRGADTMFTNVIESYYGTQVFSLCFEVYYFIQSFSTPQQFAGARKLDAVLMGVYVFHSCIMLLLSTTAAAEMGEVAMEGLEIIRRNGCMGRKSTEEMYFTLSLYMSYTGYFETALTGGKFVTFDRSFIVSLVGTIFSYYIILSQFTPPLAMTDPNKLEKIETSKLIKHVEDTRQLFGDFKVGFDTFANFTQ